MATRRKKKPTKVEKEERHNVHKQLLPMLVAVGTLTLDPDNARGHNEANIEAIANSLKKFGQRKPVIVKKDGMVITAGNGTFIAAKREGWTHIAALVTEDDELTAKAWALADNRTGELANWDYEQLVAQFGELQQGGVDVTELGWDERELNMLLQSSFTPDAVGDLPGAPSGTSGSAMKDPTIDKDAMKELLALYHRHHAGEESLGEFVLRNVKDMLELDEEHAGD